VYCDEESLGTEEKARYEEVLVKLNLLNMNLDEPDMHKLDFESYKLIFSSWLDGRNLIRLDKNKSLYTITFKEYSLKTGFNDAIIERYYKREISENDWNRFEALIYKHHFWTTDLFKERLVADGCGIIIEGRRPQASRCGKKIDQIVIRFSPDNEDEIGILYREVMEYFIKD